MISVSNLQLLLVMIYSKLFLVGMPLMLKYQLVALYRQALATAQRYLALWPSKVLHQITTTRLENLKVDNIEFLWLLLKPPRSPRINDLMFA